MVDGLNNTYVSMLLRLTKLFFDRSCMNIKICVCSIIIHLFDDSVYVSRLCVEFLKVSVNLSIAKNVYSFGVVMIDFIRRFFLYSRNN